MVLWNDEVLAQGDVLQLDLDLPSRTLRANSQLWQNYSFPLADPNDSGTRRATWLNDLAAAYRSAKAASDEGPDSDIDALSVALRQVGDDSVDANRPSQVFKNRIFVWFKNAEVAYSVPIAGISPAPEPLDSVAVVAAATLAARELRFWLSQSEVPYVLIHNSYGQVELFWEAALQVEGLVSTAQLRSLTESERQAAAQLGILPEILALEKRGRR